MRQARDRETHCSSHLQYGWCASVMTPALVDCFKWSCASRLDGESPLAMRRGCYTVACKLSMANVPAVHLL